MFKSKTFGNKSNTNNGSNQQGDAVPTATNTATATKTANAMNVDESYKPVSDSNLSAHDRFKLEMESCADEATNNNNIEKDAPAVDYDGFGKQYLAGCGVKSGQALQEGGRSQQYAPRSIGGFATSENAQHDVSKLEIGHRIIMLPPAEQKKVLQQQNQQQQQQQRPASSSTTDAASANAPATTKASTIKISELVAEEDGDEKNNDDDANSSDPRNSIIGQSGGTILKLDPKNIQVEICGNGKVLTIQKILVRGATKGEEKEIDRIRQYRISASGKGNDGNHNNHSKPLFFGGPFIPNNSANVNNTNASATASFKLFDGMIVTKKKSSENNNKKNQDYEEECDDDDVQFLTVTKVFDNGMKGTVTSGDTLMASELELVAPIRPRSNAIVVKESTKTSNGDHAQDFPVGCLVTCEKILPTTVEIRNMANGKVGTIEKMCLCSTARSR